MRLLAHRHATRCGHRAAAVAVVGPRDGRSGAALDALRPSVAVTYAEAGGWGRALVLEARRAASRSVGLQHGFIYRHWLNYLHEPDEMQPPPAATIAAFRARPDAPLRRLRGRAPDRRRRFPRESIAVTGSRGSTRSPRGPRARPDEIAAARMRPRRGERSC